MAQDHCKYETHPFEWLLGEFKGTHRNLWKDIYSEVPSFCPLVIGVLGEGNEAYFWEDQGI